MVRGMDREMVPKLVTYNTTVGRGLTNHLLKGGLGENKINTNKYTSVF